MPEDGITLGRKNSEVCRLPRCEGRDIKGHVRLGGKITLASRP